MKDIQRYRVAKLTGKCTDYNAPMIQDDAGGYVRYDSHVEIVRALEAQLEALKAMQKSDFFYHLKDAMKESIAKTIDDISKGAAAMPVFKVNAAAITPEMVRKFEEARGTLATGSIIPAYGIVGRIVRAVPTGKEAVSQKVVCIGATAGSPFTHGGLYEFEVDSHDQIRICQDNLVSDLDEKDHWKAERLRGHRNVYEVRDGYAVSRFEMP